MGSKYEKGKFSEVVKNSINITDVCRNLKLGTTCGNRNTIKKYINLFQLSIEHFHIPKNRNNTTKIPIEEILVENSTYSSTHNLKERLYKEGLKERFCEDCGQDEEWRGKKMSLILDHINGINNDNRLENLRILCPNCNSTLDTHGGKNKDRRYKLDIERVEKLHICSCGNTKKYRYSETCSECSQKKQRKIKDRPDLNTLLDEVKKTGYSKTGLKYGVSDNSIRKWIKNYQKQLAM